MFRIVIVHHKDIPTKLYPFCLGKWGEIIITGNEMYDLDNLIVSTLLVDTKYVEEMHCDLFTILPERKKSEAVNV